jgi:hypothetical protein
LLLGADCTAVVAPENPVTLRLIDQYEQPVVRLLYVGLDPATVKVKNNWQSGCWIVVCWAWTGMGGTATTIDINNQPTAMADPVGDTLNPLIPSSIFVSF